MKKIDFSNFGGKVFGWLTFIKEVPSGSRRRHIQLICKCEKVIIVDWDNLRSRKQVSCGCKKKETLIGRDHSLYSVWRAVKGRCYNPKNSAYKYYGGKGVKMCDEWRTNYESFYNWGLNNGWSDGMDIDKDIIGNGLLYSPQTCIFVTHKKNMGATSRIKLDTEKADKIRSSIVATRFLAKEYGVSKNLIRQIRNGKAWQK